MRFNGVIISHLQNDCGSFPILSWLVIFQMQKACILLTFLCASGDLQDFARHGAENDALQHPEEHGNGTLLPLNPELSRHIFGTREDDRRMVA
jgi:hypothetical protein